jgi:hypothetical protein
VISGMGSINSALIQDEVLGEVLSVFNKEKSAGPRFLSCLTSIVEACVLHEFVFVLPFHTSNVYPGHQEKLGSRIEASDLFTSLLQNNVFKYFPKEEELDEYLKFCRCGLQIHRLVGRYEMDL